MRASVNTFWYRVPLLLILLWTGGQGYRLLEPIGSRRPEGWVVFWFLGFLAVLFLLPELAQLARSAGRPIGRGIQGLANWAGVRLRSGASAARWPAWLASRSLLALLKLLRAGWVYFTRLVTLPVRTYYNPTVTAVLSTALIHWFLVACAVYFLETQHELFRSGLDDGPWAQNGLIYTLWCMAVYFTNQSLDDVALSDAAKVVSLCGLVFFLLMMTAYAASFRERRERRIHRRLRNKPRFLPMQDHYLVAGDLFSVRLILQQFQHYGISQDIVVAGLDPATATVAGLDRLESMVWAVEGNLWEREVRRQARAEQAAELVVAAANLKSGEAWRTVAAVEGDRPRVVTVVDARKGDDEIIEKVLSPRPGDPTDLHLRWDRRRAGFHATCRKIPGFVELVRDLVSFHPRPVFPRSFNLTRHFLLRRWRRSPRLAARRGHLLSLYTRFFNVVPLWPGTAEPEFDRLHCLCASGEQTYLLPLRWLQRPRAAKAAAVEERDTGKSPHRWPAAAHLVSAVDPAERRLAAKAKPKKAPPRPPEPTLADDDSPGSPSAEQPQLPTAFSRTRLEEDRRLLDKLVARKVWKQAATGRRRLVEFNYPESATALRTICERNDNLGRVETYSDLEMRSLWLSILAICGESALELLDALWPVQRTKKPRLVFDIASVDATLLDGCTSIGFGRAVRRSLESGTSPLAYRSPGGKWIPCAFGHRLRPGDQLLRLRRTDLAQFGGATGER